MKTTFRKMTSIALAVGLSVSGMTISTFAATPTAVDGETPFDSTMVLKSDGKVYESNEDGEIEVKNLSNVKAIEAGYGTIIALKDDGTVWAWGKNDHGQLGNGTQSKRDEKIETPVQVKGLKNIKQIASGKWHFLAVDKDGYVWGWGENSNGQLGVANKETISTPVKISSLGKVKKVDGGFMKTVALYANGTVATLEKNHKTEKPEYKMDKALKNITDISIDFYGLVALDKKGNVWVSGNPFAEGYQKTKQVKLFKEIKRVFSAGDDYADCIFVEKKDGSIWLWGTGGNPGQHIDVTKGFKTSIPKNIKTFVEDMGALGVRYIDSKGKVGQWEWEYTQETPTIDFFNN